MFLIDPLKIILKPPLSGCEVEHARKDNHSICNIISITNYQLTYFTDTNNKYYQVPTYFTYTNVTNIIINKVCSLRL